MLLFVIGLGIVLAGYDTLTSSSDTALPVQPSEEAQLFVDGYESVDYIKGIDGDTAVFMVDGSPMKTRFLAIDTPETNIETLGIEPWGIEAKAFTAEALENAAEIVLEIDDGSDLYDQYQRLLAWIWVDGELLNGALVREGLAEVRYLYGDYRYTDDLLELQAEAKSQKRGIWGE